MNKLVFSSDELPPDLEDRARFAAWHDLYVGTICHFDVERLTELPFSMRYEFLKVGEIGLTCCDGTIDRFTRTAGHIASDPNDDFFVNMNGDRPWAIQLGGQSYEFAPKAMSFLSTIEPGRAEHAGGASFQGAVLPRSRVNDLVRNSDDLVGLDFDPNSEVSRHLSRYVDMLLTADFAPDAALSAHIETTLLDLAALLLNGRRDATDLARVRGLPAARLQAILAEIRQGACRGDFSPHAVAAKLGFSANYIQKILYETGTTFTERVLELRLQRAREMLADPQNNRLKMSDIALSCGFNEVSYFNRCFRRRFGASPTQYRGRE